MKEKNKKRQIAKITVFMTSIFVILVSVTYAFITQVVSGTKQVVVSAGVLDLVLEEENAIIIENALPMYDEVGMIQDPFTFRLVNNGSNSANYEIKLVDVTPQTVERKCSDLGEITLNSPVGCRETIYPEELRQEALAMCKDMYPITSESECASAAQMDGAPFNTFEGFIDYFIVEGVFEDTRTLVNTYPDNVVEVSVWELYSEDIRYGLTRNGEDTIGSINDMEYTWKIDDPELTARTLEVCKNWYPEVTDEASCLETVNDDWGTNYKTFDDFIGDNFYFNGGKSFILDAGKIGANETINYDLRLWISEYIEDISLIEGMVFSFKIDVEVSQEIAEVPGKPMIDKLFASDSLGENCKTYDDGVDTFLVGQCSRNYVWYSGKLWRVVLKNNETGIMKMVTDNAITVIAYNGTPTNYTYEKGNSKFENSYADQWLNQEFLPTLHDVEDYLVTDYEWNATTITSSLPPRPAETTMVTRTVGLLNGYEYYTTYNQSDEIATYSTVYLNNGVVNWLLTPYASEKVFSIDDDGSLEVNELTYLEYGIRPAVNLRADIKYESGSGSMTNPYILKGDSIKSGVTSPLLSTRYSGEYVTFDNHLYRIVAVENGLTKIVSVDNYDLGDDNSDMRWFDRISPLTSDFSEANIKIELENYYQNLKNMDVASFDMIEPNTTWYIKTYGDYVGGSNNYKTTICAYVDANVSTLDCEKTNKTANASIALPRVGEMFTSYITRGIKDGFWTISPYSPAPNANGMFLLDSGYLSQLSVNGGDGIRPALYLKQNVVIASDNTGNGTYEKPYKIELGV